MHILRRRPGTALLAASIMVLLMVAPASATATRTYEVTITNLTTGQAFTPPLIATHRGSTHLFEVGETANIGTREIAENGNLAPMLDALAADPAVWAFSAAAAPLVPAGTPLFGTFSDSVTITITSGPGAQFLSYESMLICTNDGFTGVDSLKLPNRLGATVIAYGSGYDAGTELNTEDFADIVPPCQGLIGVSSGDAGSGTTDPALAENGVIRHHPGIQGGDDLDPGIHGWTDPVVMVTVVRVG